MSKTQTANTKLTVRLRWTVSACEVKTLKHIKSESERKKVVEKSRAGYTRVLHQAYVARGKIKTALESLQLKNATIVFHAINRQDDDKGNALRGIVIQADLYKIGSKARREQDRRIKVAILNAIQPPPPGGGDPESVLMGEDDDVTLEPCPECGPDFLCEISSDGTMIRMVPVPEDPLGLIYIDSSEQVPL